MQEDISEKISFLKKTSATTKITVITTGYKGPESCTPQEQSKQDGRETSPQYGDFCRRLHQPEDKDKTAEKTHSPSHVIERENKGKNPTEQLNLHDYKTPFFPKQQPRGNKG